jgi:hypothetical protein
MLRNPNPEQVASHGCIESCERWSSIGRHTRFVNQQSLFVLEVLQAWVDPEHKKPKTIHHQEYGNFAVDGETIRIRSRMR